MKPSFPTIRRRLCVSGVVQGVGFRPFVYGLATRLGVMGVVGNDSRGVFIEIEGAPETLATFAADLLRHPPPLARIEEVSTTDLPVQGDRNFVIVESTQAAGEHTLISPDLSICGDCLRELFDPTDRRYHYPFINCTHCGPRFTLIRDIPYDRPLTTMAAFAMCPACQAEYEDPRNRRFHAQPNACPLCGPQVELRAQRAPANGDSQLRNTQNILAAGQIVAVKGIGGFHLACDAANDQAVQELRRRKGRVDKPLAVMAWDVAAVRTFAEVSPAEEALLTSRERPIVLLRKRPDCWLSDWVAPGNRSLGVMLPYAPLHYLLLERETARQGDKETRRQGDTCPELVGGKQGADSSPPAPHDPPLVLVMTSGNYSDEPIVTENEEALEKLAPLADAFLLHNRPIQVRCDDSVVRVFAGHELPIRRSRGYAPFPVRLPFAVPAILAVGGELKSTFCLTSGDHAFMSQHIGDMANWETVQAFAQAVDHFQTLFRLQPTAIACDLHPDYLSTKWAQQTSQQRGLPLLPVQHHHAHIAALMAEHGLDGTTPVIGFAFDGTGYGPDGAIWGGELLIADYRSYQRLGQLKYVPLPGGDAAVKRPYRLALAHLWAARVEWQPTLPPLAAATPTELGVLQRQFASGFQTVPTSSMGRLFDAIAALIGLRQTITYEGQAAIELEAICDEQEGAAYQFAVSGDDVLIFDPAPVIRAVVADTLVGIPAPLIAQRFHRAVAHLISEVSLRVRKRTGLNQVALSGGVFQNTHLLALAVQQLQNEHFAVFWHRRVPPNDGGLALGQALVAVSSRKQSVNSIQSSVSWSVLLITDH